MELMDVEGAELPMIGLSEGPSSSSPPNDLKREPLIQVEEVAKEEQEWGQVLNVHEELRLDSRTFLGEPLQDTWA